jgi:molybdopterin converting factor small subunit
VRVRVLFFGEMRRHLPPGREHVELELADGALVRDALARVGVQQADERIVGLGGALAQDTTPLHDGDELSLYHPMGGGATSTRE